MPLSAVRARARSARGAVAARRSALSRRTLLRGSLAGAGALLAACTLDRVDRELPPVQLPPVEVVRPPPLPTATPETSQAVPGPAQAADSPPHATSATIRFEAWGPRVLLEAFREIRQEFQAQAPWITADARLDNALTSDALRSRLRLGDGPDVGRMAPQDVFDFTAAGFLHGLGARIDADPEMSDAAPGAAAARTGAGGERSALSLGAAHQCVLYNEAHLETAGVSAPTSWQRTWTRQEFEEAAKRLVIASDRRVERFGLTAIPAYARPVLAEGYEGGFLDSEQRTSILATPERLVRLQRLTSWQTALAIELPIAYRFVAPFSGGLASMHIDRLDVGRWIRAGVPWAAAPLPAWYGRQALTEADELCVGVAAGSPEPDAAWAFARFLLDMPAQRALARTNLFTPVRLETLEDPAFLDPNQRPFDRAPLVEAAPRAMRSPAHPGAKTWHALTGDPIAVVRRGHQEAGPYLDRADALITRQLRLRDWSSASDRPGYRQPQPYGNRFLADLEARGL